MKKIERKWMSGMKMSTLAFLTTVFLFSVVAVPVSMVSAQSKADEENINSEGFKLVICDGPAGLKQHLDASSEEYKKFVPCNFQGFMMQIQRLINVMVILGVVAALGGFSYAGYLYITGVPGNITRAYEIFKKVGIGFIIMLSAWAIVYQILKWLTDENQFKGLLN